MLSREAVFGPDVFTRFFLRDIGVLTADFERLLAASLPEFFAACFALLFLCTASFVFLRASRWPLLNVLLLLLAVRGYAALWHLLSVGAAPRVARYVADALLVRMFPSAVMAILAVVLLLIDILFIPAEMETAGGIVNRPLLGRISGFLFAFAAIGFGLLFAYSAVSFPVGRFLPWFQWEYALKNGFLLFIEALLPLCAAAIAVAASLAGSSAARRAAGQPAQPFSRTAVSTIIAFILIAVAYTVLFEVSAPAARRRLSDMQYQSSLAREFKARAEQARKAGDWVEARDELALYLAIDKGNKPMTALKLEAEEEAARRKPTPAKPVPAREPPTDVDAAAYVGKARYYFDREDWFSAHYYASQAAAFDPKRTDAPRLAALAWQKIACGELRAKDDKAAAVFREKRDAYLLLQKDSVAAYYRFVELSSRTRRIPTSRSISPRARGR